MVKEYTRLKGLHSNKIELEGAIFRYESMLERKNEKQEVIGGWHYYVCRSSTKMSHIPSIKQFNCNSRVRIAIPLIDNNECEFMREHGGNCPFKEPHNTQLRVK